VRPALALLAMILIGTPGFSQQQKILLRALQTVVVPSAAELKSRCSSGVHIYACTAFGQRNLNAACHVDGDRWKLRVSYEVKPVMYLWDTAWIRHELLHLGDIANSLEQYKGELESRDYKSISDCERAAAAESAGFARELSVFVDASNKLRHSIYR